MNIKTIHHLINNFLQLAWSISSISSYHIEIQLKLDFSFLLQNKVDPSCVMMCKWSRTNMNIQKISKFIYLFYLIKLLFIRGICFFLLFLFFILINHVNLIFLFDLRTKWSAVILNSKDEILKSIFIDFQSPFIYLTVDLKE